MKPELIGKTVTKKLIDRQIIPHSSTLIIIPIQYSFVTEKQGAKSASYNNHHFSSSLPPFPPLSLSPIKRKSPNPTPKSPESQQQHP